MIDWNKPIRIVKSRKDLSSVRVLGFLDDGKRVAVAYGYTSNPSYENILSYSVTENNPDWIENMPKPKKKLLQAIMSQRNFMGYFTRFFVDEAQMRTYLRLEGADTFKLLSFKEIEVEECE